MTVETSSDGELDRNFLDLSSKLSDVFCWTYGRLGSRLVASLEPGKFDNTDTVVGEIAIRTLIALGVGLSFYLLTIQVLLGAVVLGFGSKILRSLGFVFQKQGFTHIRGSAPEQPIKGTIMTWNIRGLGGGLSYPRGVVHWISRVDRIVEKLIHEKADVVVLQEVYDPSLVEALVERLSDQYAHFYTYAGASVFGGGSGCMILTKCAVQRFSHTDFSSNRDKGFEMLEIKAHPNDIQPCARIFGTQLSPGKEAKEIRMEQFSQIVNALASEKLALPTFFAGTTNFDRDSEEGKYLSKYLYHSYLDRIPTQTDELAKQWAPIYDGQEESSDFISLFKRNAADGRILPVAEKDIRFQDCYLVKAFDESHNTKRALSDHHAIVTQFSGLRN